MKYAYIATVNPGYMFSMNATINANKYYGTNADVHLLYFGNFKEEYMKRCETAFPFEVRWVKMTEGNYFDAKYRYAATLKDKYDAISIIDADLFICSDTKEYFEKAANENILITGTRVRSGMKNKTDMAWNNPEEVNDRSRSYFADFPTFINPKSGQKLLDCWFKNTNKAYIPSGSFGDRYHPLIALNRCICELLSPEQTLALDGNFWNADFKISLTDFIRKDDIMINEKGERFYAIHNKWWKSGMAQHELRIAPHLKNDVEVNKRLDRLEKNMNEIRNFMIWFNEMTPSTRRDDYYKEKIDRMEYLRREEKLL